MHEIGIMQGTLDLAVQTAQAASAGQILCVRVRVGSMTGIVTEALQFAFEALREGTIASEARLEVETVPARCWCNHCQAEFEAADWLPQCPTCQNAGGQLRGGLELELTSVEVA
jgi:hydrogenase nickel incorporation protein HypA/HybF